jgi:hypothetical protein
MIQEVKRKRQIQVRKHIRRNARELEAMVLGESCCALCSGRGQLSPIQSLPRQLHHTQGSGRHSSEEQ